MTFREKLADWISGGALTRARKAHDAAMFAYRDAKEDYRLCAHGRLMAASDASYIHSRLCEIAAMETPGANATVRRMAKVAREALGDRE